MSVMLSPEEGIALAPIKFGIQFRISKVVNAPIDLCFKVVAEDWAGWYPHLAKVELLSPGNDSPKGVGAVRGLWREAVPIEGDEDSLLAQEEQGDVPPQVVDVCNHFWPPYLYAYKVIGFDPPVLEHSQVIYTFREVDGGTEIVACSTGAPKGDFPPEMLAEMNKQAEMNAQAVLDSCVEEIEKRAAK